VHGVWVQVLQCRASQGQMSGRGMTMNATSSQHCCPDWLKRLRGRLEARCSSKGFVQDLGGAKPLCVLQGDGSCVEGCKEYVLKFALCPIQAPPLLLSFEDCLCHRWTRLEFVSLNRCPSSISPSTSRFPLGCLQTNVEGENPSNTKLAAVHPSDLAVINTDPLSITGAHKSYLRSKAAVNLGFQKQCLTKLVPSLT
jgi:hypothetical protein